jgi:hypothetical protein
MAVGVGQNGQSGDPLLYRGVSEGTAMAAADLARMTLAGDAAEDVEQMQSCECCGLAEECTPSYVSQVRATFCGRYVCGLCTEAVREERWRLNPAATMEEGLSAHMKVCAQFNVADRVDPLVQLANIADLMRQILRKSSSPSSSPNNSVKRPMNVKSHSWRSSPPPLSLARSKSCFPGTPPSDSA